MGRQIVYIWYEGELSYAHGFSPLFEGSQLFIYGSAAKSAAKSAACFP